MGIKVAERFKSVACTVNTKTKESDNRVSGGKVVWKKAVSLKKRLICLTIMILAGLAFGYFSLDGPIQRTASGSHVVTIQEPGSYLAFFRGDLKDPYGWKVNGGFIRKSFEIKMWPVDPKTGKVKKLPSFKDLSHPGMFSVAEFEIYTPGDYFLSFDWKQHKNKCDGYIVLEKNVVEKFFYKWACGIIGLLAFLAILGFPIGPDYSN